MNGRFGIAETYEVDPGAWLQREHRERRAREAREDRAAKWIAARLVGRTFGSYETLCNAACAEAVAHYGRALREDEHEVLTRACRGLWSGLTLRGVIAPTRRVACTRGVGFESAA